MKNVSLIKSILTTALVAGTVDIINAIIFLANGNVEGTFRYIARGAFGDLALSGGKEMILLGVFFHYLIALAFTIAYYMAYPLMPILGKYKIGAGLLYGILVWVIMHFMVLPLTHNSPAITLVQTIWKPILILMVSIGLPISLLTRHYYNRAQG